MVQMWSTTKTQLSYYDRLDKVWYVTKTRQENNVTDRISQFTLKPKLNYRHISNKVRFVMKTKMYNDMTDHIGVIYTENDNKLLRLIVSATIYYEI